MLRTLLLCSLAIALAACSSGPPTEGTRDGAVDRIVVKYGPEGELDTPAMVTAELTDPAVVTRWMTALEAIPETPERGVRMIKFVPNAPRYRLEFFAGTDLRDVRRMRGSHLDVRSHPGWAFYSGEDNEFCALVTAFVPGE